MDELQVGYENSTKRRRKITLHSFRRYTKSTISDLGYADYSEWVLGHAGSPYYQKSDKEKFELFKKIMPYLTFLDQSGLEKQSAVLSDRLETMERENIELKTNRRDLEKRLNRLEMLAKDFVKRKSG
jgi:hypothetical protein